MTIYNQINANRWKTIGIMILFFIFFGIVSFLIGRTLGYGLGFVGVLLVISGAVSFGSYYYSDKLVLSMSGAKPASKSEHRELYTIVENLSIASGMPMPKVYVVNDPALNAFATGRDPKHGVVCATTGILQALNKSELEGVIAHELSHIRNYDTRLMGVVGILAGSIAILADVFMHSMLWGGRDDNKGGNGLALVITIVAAILAPIAATIIQLAISRRREFLADASGALLTRYPEGLASALEKIAASPRVVKSASNATAHLYIENPFKTDSKQKTTSFLAGLFSTHPPVEKRIKILRSM